MSRNLSFVVAVAVVSLNGQAANAQNQIVNYFVRGVESGGNLVVIPSAPAGLVITDIEFYDFSFGAKFFEYTSSGDLIGEIWATSEVDILTKTYTSGIVVGEGNQLRVDNFGSDTQMVAIFLSGYIQSPALSGNIPAVGTWGLSILGLLILVSATLMIAKRRSIIV